MVAIHTPQQAYEQGIRETVSKVLDANAIATHPRLTVTDRDQGAIHYEANGDAIYFAVTTESYPQRVAFRAIAEMKARFEGGLGDALHKAEEGGLSKSAKPLLSELCTRFADEASLDKALGVMRQVNEVKGIMAESVQALLQTNENLEVLEDRADTLKRQTQSFHRSAREVRRTEQKKNSRLGNVSCIFLVVLIVVAAMPLIIMFWPELSDFFGTMFPPEQNSTAVESGSGDAGSGDPGSGGGLHNASQAPVGLGLG